MTPDLFNQQNPTQQAYPIDLASAWVGTDEAGKGDYFGPLVIAAVCADEISASRMQEWGITDSKKVSDGRAASLARQIVAAGIPHAVIAIGPTKYNELYAKMRNLNRLLAWGHARAIENVLDKAPAQKVVTDQFGDPSLVENALMQKGRTINLIQMHRGEADIAVAAASILARAEFLRRLDQLGKTVGYSLHKGAGAPVDEVAARILKEKGLDTLLTVAKHHFKNTEKATRLAGRTKAH